jgi:phosphoglycerate kinase
MKFGIRTLDDFDLRGRTVLCRVDINQPVDRATGQLKDTTRIRACVPTVRELAQSGAKVVLLAHQGSDIEYKNYYTTAPHAQVLRALSGLEIGFIDDVCGPAARAAIRDLKDGEVLLLDNVRFLAEEQTLFEMKLDLTQAQQAETLLVRWRTCMCATLSPPRTATSPRCAASSRCCLRPWGACSKRSSASFRN